MSSTTSKLEPSDEYLVRFLSDGEYRREAFAVADRLVDEDVTDEGTVLAWTHGDGILAELVTHLAASRRVVRSLAEPVSVGIVFAVWKEARRLQPRTERNPAGEDALRAKVAELEWLFRDAPVSWRLYIVDDECPEGSLEVARAIVEEDGLESVELLRLRDALPAAEPPLSKLAAADLSVKGGALLLGLRRASARGHDYVMFTDCDNSNNLGQIGLLLEPFLTGGVRAAIGDRRSTRVSHWQDSRDSESTANYVLKRVRQLLAFDLILRDVTCPFKMFDRACLAAMLEELDVFDFCVDYDMLGYLQHEGTPLAVVPIVSLDSETETTWVPLGNASVWWQKLRGFVHVVEKYGLPHDREAADLVRRHLTSQEAVAAVLRAGEQGVVLGGRPISPAEQLQMDLGEVEEWLCAVLSE
ncbi:MULTISPECIES: glycosyltransferase [Clavibacter]|uniref:Glycosyltransferase 2-like domain-containing protein n=1 Tax=Clavibacter tessellarius TaxID=31965 RepID=A0A154V2A5_9MICO|nr:glycosyltransferase [Clavibacter michiganensis]KZC95513.1 hypothetical protein AWH51_07720 [Clavibacter michiganensis subsp. tessellarius]